MTTATLRFTYDVARSAMTRPDLSMIFADRAIGHYARDIPIHDPEPVVPEVIDLWEPTDLDLEEWPYEEPAPRKTIRPDLLPVVSDFRRPWPW